MISEAETRKTILESLIPRPISIQENSGAWRIPAVPKITGSLPSPAAKSILKDALAAAGGSGSGSIDFALVETKAGEINAEAYCLTISDEIITIESPAPAGLFRGAVVLAQLIRLAAADCEATLPCSRIDDEPRFPWRGYMLDSSRHFQPVDTVKRLIDVMAFYRMNVLHFHLTDDQGWRLDIPELPELARVASKRSDSLGSKNALGKRKPSGVAHQGCYRTEDIKGIIDYAAERFIEVVPEVDVPGHVLAVLAAYPKLGCTGGPYEVPWINGIFSDVLCTSKDEVWDFMEKVVAEVVRLFPSKRLHFGGDEIPKTAKWTSCPRCRAHRKDEGLKSIHDQQAHFSRRLVDLAAKHGRRAMFWSEACMNDFPEDVSGQYWLFGKKKAYDQLEEGRKILFSKHGGTYLDMTYAYLPLSRCYLYDPALAPDLSDEAEKNILGVEGPMWTEWITNEKLLHYQSFPRAIALSERGWSKADVRDYENFEERLKTHLPVLDGMGIGYAPAKEWNRGFQLLLWRLFGRKW